jgi:hypothetical protein
LLLSLSLSLPSLALAAPKGAGEHEKKGQIAFVKKDWPLAKSEYAAAWEISKSADDAYFAGRAAEELGTFAEAAGWYGKVTSGAHDKDARARLAALEKKPVAVTIETVPEGATVRIDGTASSQKSPFFVRLVPGPHRIVAEYEGKTAAKDVEVAPFVSMNVKLEVGAPTSTTAPAEPAPTPPPAPVEPAPAPAPVEPAAAPIVDTQKTTTTSGTRTAAYVTGGIAIVALGFGTLYGIKALDDKSKYDDHPTQERADLGKRDRLVADNSLAIGIGLAVTSVVLYEKSTKHEVALAPMASPTTAGLAFAARF